MLFRFVTLFTFVLGTSIVSWSADVADSEVPTGDTAAIAETPSQSPSPDPAERAEEEPSAPVSLAITSPLPEKVVVDADGEEIPWDFSPYHVLVWLVTDEATVNAKSVEEPLREYLDRDFSAVWRMKIADAPASIRSAAFRDMRSLSYDTITAADPVLAVKRDHREAVRIRIAKNVGEFVKKIYGTKERIAEVKARGAAKGDDTLEGVAPRLEAIEGDAIAVRKLWTDENTEAVLLSRGMAMTLDEPEAKLIAPPIIDLIGEAANAYDKIFVVRVQGKRIPNEIDVVEFDTLMRHVGPVARVQNTTPSGLPASIGRGIVKAFAPVIRIENAGQKNAVGLLRAGGLIVDEDSPAGVRTNDLFEPMTRKNDRNGKPIIIGPIDWACLLVTEIEGRNIQMDYYAGRAGGLQGRKNKRTFRTALKVRTFEDSTVLRLHLQRNPNFPLIGYELYEKELKSTKMTFIGRTDWDGRLNIGRTEDPFRLLYVKNGGAVLARLPLIPGLKPQAVADLSGDDMRLQAEAYIRGVQNAIIDLVAIRELFKARIRLRLTKGQMEKAEALMIALREQPTNERLATDMGKKQAAFLKALGTRNANQRRKVDEMFTTTRELLTKHINPQLVRELESDLIAAKNNGGKLPPRKKKASEDEETAEATEPSAKDTE